MIPLPAMVAVAVALASASVALATGYAESPADRVVLAASAIGVLALLSAHLTAVGLRPVEETTRRLEGLGRGDFGLRVPPQGPAETVRLAEAVNSAAAALAWRERELVERERSATVGTMLTGVSHAINNPLTFLVVNETLLHDEARARAKDDGLTAEARREAERALRLHARNLDGLRRIGDISSLLVEISRTSGSPSPTRIDRVVEGSLIVTQHALVRAGVEVQTDLRSRSAVLCDGARLAQALVALLLNAAEAMPRGGTLTVRTRDVGESVRVHLVDTGEGIPPAVRPHLFEAFTTTKPGRSGLGLATARRVVEDAGGHISYVSEVGAGSTFTVELPRAAVA